MNIDRAEKMTNKQRELVLQGLMLLEIDRIENSKEDADISEASYIRMIINAFVKKFYI